MGCLEGVPWLNYEGVLVNMACCVHLLGLICMDLLTCLTTCQDRQVHNNDAIRKGNCSTISSNFHLLQWHAEMILQVASSLDDD